MSYSREDMEEMVAQTFAARKMSDAYNMLKQILEHGVPEKKPEPEFFEGQYIEYFDDESPYGEDNYKWVLARYCEYIHEKKKVRSAKNCAQWRKVPDQSMPKWLDDNDWVVLATNCGQYRSGEANDGWNWNNITHVMLVPPVEED